MKDVTITIPDNCDLVKEGNTYVIKEKDTKPKSWKAFCENFLLGKEEYYIDSEGEIRPAPIFDNVKRREYEDRNLCVSIEEAQAFLALIQLRQLRKAWVGDWEQPNSNTETAAILYSVNTQEVMVHYSNFWASNVLSFPTEEIAQEFLDCFRDLCETAKCLL